MVTNLDNINFDNLSVAELDKFIAKAEAAKQVPTGLRAIALITAVKQGISELRKIDETILGEVLGAIAPQALPKEATTARKYNLSETQVQNAKDKATKAIAAL